MPFDEIVNTIREDTDRRIYEDVFKSASKDSLKDRGYTGKKYGLWIGDYLDGYVMSKDYALEWARKMYAKNGDREGIIKVMEVDTNTKMHPMVKNGKQIFPEVNEDVFKGPTDKQLKDRGALTAEEQRILRFRESITDQGDNPIYTSKNGDVYTNSDFRRMLFMTDMDKYSKLNGLYKVSKDSYQDVIRVYGIDGQIYDRMTIDDLFARYEKGMPRRSYDDPFDRFQSDVEHEDEWGPTSVDEAEDPFKGADPEDVKQRQEDHFLNWEKKIHAVARARGIEIEYIIPPIDNDHLSDFWYEGDVAIVRNPSKDRVVTLTAQGEIRVSFPDEPQETYRNYRAREAAWDRGYKDSDLADMQWENNNWFEFWYEGPEWDGRADISVVEGADVMGSYNEGLEWAVDLISDDNLWYDITGHLWDEDFLNEDKDPFQGPDPEELASRKDYQRDRIRIEQQQRAWAERQRRREERMRIRPDQPNLIKQWGTEGRNRGKASALKVEGDILWSYGTPIALRRPDGIYLISLRFSVTTSKHQSYVRRLAGAGVDVWEVSPRRFKELLNDTPGWDGRYGWIREDIFKGPSEEDLEKRGALKYQPKKGNFPFKFMRHIEDPDPEETHWDIVGMGRYINQADSYIYFNINDADPEFIIMLDTRYIIDDYLSEIPALTRELREFDGGVEDWIKSKGWETEWWGHTANDDNYYYWGDETFGYTSFSGKDHEGVVLEFRYGESPIVYEGDVSEFLFALTVQEPKNEIATLFGYDHYKNLIRDIKDYRGTLTDEERAEPRDEEPTPGQYRWTGDMGDTYMESVDEDVFQGPDPEDIQARKDRAKELWKKRYDFPFTYDDMTELPIYKKIVSLPNVSDLTQPKRQKNRSFHFQWKKAAGDVPVMGRKRDIVWGGDSGGYRVKDWDVSAMGRIGTHSGVGFRGGYHSRLRQMPRANNIEDVENILKEAYWTIYRFIRKADPKSLALDLSPKKVKEDVFKGPDQDDVHSRRRKQIEKDREQYRKIGNDLQELARTKSTTGTGHWGIIVHNQTGDFVEDTYFTELDDLRQELADYFYLDPRLSMNSFNMTLSELLALGDMELYELSVEQIQGKPFPPGREKSDDQAIEDAIDELGEAKDPFKEADPKDVENRRKEASKRRWNIEAEIRKDIAEIVADMEQEGKLTGTGYWAVHDLQGGGLKQDQVFRSPEEVRMALADFHSIDWCGDEPEDECDPFDELLSNFLAIGGWELYELTEDDVVYSKEIGEIE